MILGTLWKLIKPIKAERKEREKEILEIRQKVYSKLNEGQNVFLMLKMFKGIYRAELSYDEEKFWRDKVIITRKAVFRNEKELKDENIQEMIKVFLQLPRGCSTL